MTVTAVTFRVGVDIGGTFTDIIVRSSDGTMMTKKISSTPDDYSRAIIQGLSECMTEFGFPGADIQEIIHGTTVATNAILEQKGARTALITTRGFRDVLELRRLRTPELYNPFWVKPKPLVPRRLRAEVDERINARGEIVKPLDPSEALTVLNRILTGDVESVAVCLINSYANPTHEEIIKGLLVKHFTGLHVSISSEILPEIKEYERTSTTVVNAYIMPVVERYLDSLMSNLRKHGIVASLLIMQSNGGMTTARGAMEKPMHIIESGPAAGVIATAHFARRLGIRNLIAFDMGGTTAKASLVEDGQVTQTPEAEVGAQISSISRLMKGSGYLLRSPFIDVAEVGAGGGSIVWLDKGNLIHVGPHSAGAAPGPVCYEQGGTEPTLTDANVVLGFINPRQLLAGAMQINRAVAVAALTEKIAGPVGMELYECAYGVHLIGNSNMTRAIRAVSTERGRDPREFALCAFGGSGPVHAATLAGSLDIRKVIVPPFPGLFSALGLLFAEVEHHLYRTYFCKFGDLDLTRLNAIIADLEAEATTTLATEGYTGHGMRLERQVDLRYAGQSYELTIAAPAGILTAETLAALEESFGQEHEKTYGHRATGNDEAIELVNIRVIGRGLHGQQMGLVGEKIISRPTSPSRRSVYFGPRWGFHETPILDRPALSSAPTRGPLIVEEYDATTVVPPDWQASRDAAGNIVLDLL
jgi:N-methylhydantoinase A